MGRIQQTRYDELLRRTTDQYGGGSKVGEALEDLFPVIEVENAPIELLRATGWNMGMGFVDRTSAVAETNVQQLFNPIGSGHIIVITGCYITVSATGSVNFGPSFTALADGSIGGAQRDLRAGVIRVTVGLTQREDNATASLFGRIIATANIPFKLEDQNGVAVLAPGTGFRIATLGTNVTMKTSWIWRERIALGPELNF